MDQWWSGRLIASAGGVLSNDDMAQIATLDRGATQFSGHADPGMVHWLSARRAPA